MYSDLPSSLWQYSDAPLGGDIIAALSLLASGIFGELTFVASIPPFTSPLPLAGVWIDELGEWPAPMAIGVADAPAPPGLHACWYAAFVGLVQACMLLGLTTFGFAPAFPVAGLSPPTTLVEGYEYGMWGLWAVGRIAVGAPYCGSIVAAWA